MNNLWFLKFEKKYLGYWFNEKYEWHFDDNLINFVNDKNLAEYLHFYQDCKTTNLLIRQNIPISLPW